jgi:D-alanyl-D-alanine carboxypeptidase
MALNLSKLKTIYEKLGISLNYFEDYKHWFYSDPGEKALSYGGKDCFNRDFYLHYAALEALNHLFKQAEKDHIELKVVSAYRSFDYQANLIKRKLDAGLTISQILKVNAPPGLSEHHTGRAVDLTCNEENQPLTRNFENTRAFEWLKDALPLTSLDPSPIAADLVKKGSETLSVMRA